MTVFIDDLSDNQENIKISFINEINTEHLPKFVSYTSNCVLHNESLTEEFESVSLPCDCKNLCDQKCPCSLNSNAYSNHKLSQDYNNHTGRPIIECSELTGLGVQSKEFIPKFSFVCEYAGEIIDEQEAYQRLKNHSPEDSNYIYVLKEHSSDHKYIKTIIDPTYIGNVGRYLNHSCSPNLISVPVRAGSMIPRICFFAKEDILPLQELTYNYGGECIFDESGSSHINSCARKCLCGSVNCCGYLPYVNDNWLK
ncbi:histone-lysine N-methyltransferase SETMAR [Caerostris extrusa]|uniref:Histone-lysine N-methyltransferase SETMAR n=1 Tax=Caerostris extrusa TaxID=172846 RepID=A0AAV4P3R7_CAEEX|nr:histone-lysine N-methyltransferase SETMAR [Caerostris extrusa]